MAVIAYALHMDMMKEYPLPDSLVAELESSLETGPIFEENGEESHMILEWLVDSIKGLSVVFHSNDHPPPHFHVEYNGESNSFRIDDGTPLHPNNGLKAYFRNIKKWHHKNRKLLANEYSKVIQASRPQASR